MKHCPICKSEIKKGYISGLSRVAFIEEKRLFAIYEKEGELTVAHKNGLVAQADAFLCSNCGYIFVPFEAKGENL